MEACYLHSFLIFADILYLWIVLKKDSKIRELKTQTDQTDACMYTPCQEMP